MSILHPIKPQELKDHFVYRGFLAGCVPVYLGAIDQDSPMLSERNGVPCWCLDLAIGACMLVDGICQALGMPQANGLPIQITSRLDGTPLDDDPLMNDD